MPKVQVQHSTVLTSEQGLLCSHCLHCPALTDLLVPLGCSTLSAVAKLLRNSSFCLKCDPLLEVFPASYNRQGCESSSSLNCLYCSLRANGLQSYTGLRATNHVMTALWGQFQGEQSLVPSHVLIQVSEDVHTPMANRGVGSLSFLGHMKSLLCSH